jgi:hypothetical protein
MNTGAPNPAPAPGSPNNSNQFANVFDWIRHQHQLHYGNPPVTQPVVDAAPAIATALVPPVTSAKGRSVAAIERRK